MIKFTVKNTDLTFAVRVQPRASQSAIVGEIDGALKVRLTAPPVDGAANEELVRFLSKLFDIPRQNIMIVSGATAKNKIIRITGLTAEAFLKAVQS